MTDFSLVQPKGSYIFAAKKVRIMRRDVFQAIADPTRREILNMVSLKLLNINSASGHFEISPPRFTNISRY